MVNEAKTRISKKNEYYYFEYLKKHNSKYDLLHNELDRRIYSFGNNLKSSYERPGKSEWLNKKYVLILVFIYQKFRIRRDKSKNKVFTSGYYGLGQKLRLKNLEVFSMPWMLNREGSPLKIKDFIFLLNFKKQLNKLSFFELLSDEFQHEIKKIEKIFENVFLKKQVKGIFIPNDVGFFEKLAIIIAKKLSIPTFLVMHGTAPRYGNTINDNRTDYLCVFGDLFKEKFIECGFNAEKILVMGHPIFSDLPLPKKLRYDLKDILVISKPINGVPVEVHEKGEGRERDTNRLLDRGNTILYLLMIERTLRRMNITQVRFRVHPSENPDWFLTFLNPSFFIIDKDNLKVSLNKSTLVIGPTSGVLFDAIYHGVNYVVFEPIYDDGLDIFNDPLGSPFDGSESRVPVAKDTNTLFDILSQKKAIDITILKEYITPKFDLSEVIKRLAN